MATFILDTYAWIEYFIGSEKGEIVRKLLIGKVGDGMVTVACSLAELKGWCLRTGNDFTNVYKVVRSTSHIVGVTEQNWLDAASIKSALRKEHVDFGLLDAILVAKQQEISGKIVSGDKHFAKMPNIIFLK